jgi:hypothetical protein
MKNNTLYTIILGGLLWNCSSETLEDPVDCTINPPIVNLDEKTDANCGIADGSAQLSASAGEGPYTFSSDQFTSDGNGLFANLPAGNHTFTVTDGNKCTGTLAVSIGNVDGVTATIAVTNDAGCGGTLGEITVDASMGLAPYLYKVGDGAFQDNNVLSGLTNSSHTVTVKDANDCEFSQSTIISSGISYTASISPIIIASCATSGCHNGSNSLPDFNQFSNVQMNAAGIKSRTQSGNMPKGGSLDQSQIDLIACWVDDGALNN